jgi:hypothetical protein
MRLPEAWQEQRNRTSSLFRKHQQHAVGAPRLSRWALRADSEKRECSCLSAPVTLCHFGTELDSLPLVCECSVAENEGTDLCFQPCIHNLVCAAFLASQTVAGGQQKLGLAIMSAAISGYRELAPRETPTPTPPAPLPQTIAGYVLEVPGCRSDEALEAIAGTIERHLSTVASAGRLVVHELLVSGYGHDARELWEIPEVLGWAQEAQRRWPHYASLLAPESMLRFYAWCHPDLLSRDVRGIEFRLKPHDFARFAGASLEPLHASLLERGLAAPRAAEILFEAAQNWVAAGSGAKYGPDYRLAITAGA